MDVMQPSSRGYTRVPSVLGRLTALLPQGQMLLPDWGGASGFTGIQIVHFTKLRQVWGVDVVVIDGLGSLLARHLVWVIGSSPLQRYVGIYETRVLHDRWGASRLRDLPLATVRMAGSNLRSRTTRLALRLAHWSS